MRSVWKPFQTFHRYPCIPPLLIKHDFGPSNYSVWLTDLTFIWSESLDRKQIIRRAFDIDTSIDPTEGADQLRLFLRGMEDALKQGAGTSVDIEQSDDEAKLILRTSTSLPGGLKPLEWSFLLTRASQATMTSEFLLPLLGHQLVAKAEKASLLQQLKEKDHVIAKLIDKMQADGVELGKVFPGAASSKSWTGSNARQGVAIKGLAEFDQEQWQARLSRDNAPSGNLDDLLPKIFEAAVPDMGEELQISNHDEWWKRLGDLNLQQPSSETQTEIETGKLVVEDFQVCENVFFLQFCYEVADSIQRQSTPPKRFTGPRSENMLMDVKSKFPRNTSKGPGPPPSDNGSTTDESDESSQSSLFKPAPPSVEGSVDAGDATKRRESQTPSKAAIGRPRYRDLDTGLDGSRPVPGNSSPTGDLSTDAMELDSGSLNGPRQIVNNPATENHGMPRAKPRLGKIGGRIIDREPSNPPDVPETKIRLGKIGVKSKPGRMGASEAVPKESEAALSNTRRDNVSPKKEQEKKSLSVPAIAGMERAGRVSQRPQSLSPPRETSQERANRKRELLKRELENKSQAAKKKKRKF